MKQDTKKIVFEYGAMSSRYSIEADNKLIAYAGMMFHFGSNSYHMIALYEPKKIVENDSWLMQLTGMQERLDEIFDGDFDGYVENHLSEIKSAMETIKELY
jgi:hypothetical protein